MISLFRNDHLDDGKSSIGNVLIATAFGISPLSNFARIPSKSSLIRFDINPTSEGLFPQISREKAVKIVSEYELQDHDDLFCAIENGEYDGYHDKADEMLKETT